MLRIAYIALFLALGAVSATAASLVHDSTAKSPITVRSDSLENSSIPGPGGSTIARRNEPGIFEMITNLPTDWRDWVVSNLQWKYWPQTALITASTAAMIIYDNQLWKPFSNEYNRNSTYQTLSDLFVDIGDGKFQFGLAAAYAGYGLLWDDARALRTASQIAEVILAAGGVVQLLKHVTGRESPIDITTNPSGRWDWFPNQIDYLHHTSHYDAFPSGHLTTALATLTVIANNYPEDKWIRPVGYALCTGLAVGLVSQSIHWWSDYPLAIAFGITFGNLCSPNPEGDVSITEPSSKKSMGALQQTVVKFLAQTAFVPVYEPDGIGVGMNVRF